MIWNKRVVDVLYLVEHVARELDIACIIKHICEKRYGLSVKVASLPFEVNSIVHQYLPKVVVVPYFNPQVSGISPLVKSLTDSTFLNLNYEQFFSKSNERYKAPSTGGSGVVVYHCAWSKSFMDYLMAYGVSEKKIFVNGNPVYTLYQKPYSSYFSTRKELALKNGLATENPWLFFPENYGWAFLTDSEIKDKIETGYNPEMAYAQREFNQKSLREVIHWFDKVSQKHAIEVIIRPRPAISTGEYGALVKEELGKAPPSVHIIKEGTTREWNLASDIVVSSLSTTLLEAAVAGKPAYVLEPIKFPDWLHPGFLDLVPHLNSYGDFEGVCVNKPDNNSSKLLREYLVENNMVKDDAIEDIAKILYGLCQSKTPGMAAVNKGQIQSSVRGLIKSARASVSSRLRTNVRFEYDRFSERDVQERTKRWGEIPYAQGLSGGQNVKA